VTDEAITFTASAQKPNGDTLNVTRAVRRDDLQSARIYRAWFHTDDPPVFPGTTGFSVSTAVWNEIRTQGRTSFALETDGGLAGMGALLGGLLPGADDAVRAAASDAHIKKGALERVAVQPVLIPMLLNDRRVALRAIHARGDIGGSPAELYILDDGGNPLVLRWTHEGMKSEVIKISFPAETVARHIEDALKTDGRADVYGIYFDFARATLRPESEAVLEEIADLMRRNSQWRLSINGHTDNIGGNASNIELSKRRAEAVRRALVERHGIAAARMTTGGFGAANPAETNDTIAGRARNRRVELVRLP
jgi:hypothetical protein